MAEYKNTFNLASAAGQLRTTADKKNPRAQLFGQDIALSPQRKLNGAIAKFDTAATQTVTVSIIDFDGNARVISSTDVVAATDYFFEPEHDWWIGAGEHFQIDVTATGAPAVTGTLMIFTEEA